MAVQKGELFIIEGVDRACSRNVIEVLVDRGDVVLCKYLDRRKTCEVMRVRPELLRPLGAYGVTLRETDAVHKVLAVQDPDQGDGWDPEPRSMLKFKDKLTTYTRAHCVRWYMMRLWPWVRVDSVRYVMAFLEKLDQFEYESMGDVVAYAEQVEGLVRDR